MIGINGPCGRCGHNVLHFEGGMMDPLDLIATCERCGARHDGRNYDGSLGDVIRSAPEDYHRGCGRYGSKRIIEPDGSQWDVCLKCGEAIRQITR